MDVSARRIARGAAYVNLIIKLLQERLYVLARSARTYHLSSSCCLNCFAEDYCGILTYQSGVVDFGKIAAQCS